jgi:hypothetical protein
MLVSMRAKGPSTDAGTQPHDEVAAQQAYLAVAHHLVQLDRPACGLWPVPEDMGLAEPSRKLAAALAALGFKVGLMAPRARWREDASPSEPPLSISPADDGFDVLTPGWLSGADAGAVIERTLALVRDRYTRVLLDLSGLDILGLDQSAIVPGLDVVLFVAAGRTNEFALARMRRRLPPERILGVVLVDMAEGEPAGLA